MSIQANFNQLLSLAAMAARFAPGAERKAQIKQLTKRAETASNASEKAMDALVESGEWDDPTSEAYKLTALTEEEALSAQMDLFRADPTIEHAKMIARDRTLLEWTKRDMAEARNAREKAEGTSPEEALANEQSRIANSNEVVRGLDLDRLAEGPRSRVERAYKKAEKDTYYLNKKGGV